MVWREQMGWLNSVFCNQDKIADEKEGCRMKMGIIWSI